MLLTQAIALLSVCTHCAPQGPTAKELIEKMLVRYHSAKTLTGKIRLTVSAKGNTASLDTALQYERPAKLYIQQHKNVANPEPDQPYKWLVTSDGVSFSYNIPNDRYASAPTLRLLEPVANTRVRMSHDIASIYAASSKSIGDRSMPLDIAIAAKADLIYRKGQWSNFSLIGEKQVNGKPAFLVGGDFREYLGAPTSGRYQMAITASGDLLQYVEDCKFAIGEGPGAETVQIVSQWDVDLVVNGTVQAGLFKVVL